MSDMSDAEMRKAAKELVSNYKLSGLAMADIASLLVFGLEAVVRDPETRSATRAVLALAIGSK